MTSASTVPTDPPTSPRTSRSPADDPVRARRRQVAKWTLLANRIGWLCYAVAMATFVIGFALGFSGGVAAVVIAALVVGSVLLAPTIILGYAIKAAERDDRERGF